MFHILKNHWSLCLKFSPCVREFWNALSVLLLFWRHLFSVLKFPLIIFHRFQISGETFYFSEISLCLAFPENADVWILCGSVSMVCAYFSSFGWPNILVSQITMNWGLREQNLCLGDQKPQVKVSAGHISLEAPGDFFPCLLRLSLVCGCISPISDHGHVHASPSWASQIYTLQFSVLCRGDWSAAATGRGDVPQ